jgi:hypothetical protein
VAWVGAVVVARGGGGQPAQASSSNEVDADWHTLESPPLESGQFELLTLSTLPDTVTGGDVLMAVRGLPSAADLRVTRNAEDVTGVFEAVADDERHGLVAGLTDGENTIEATSGDQVARLVVRNLPVTGPVISGPHQTPFYCRTEDSGLGPPLDDNCSIEPRYDWFYRSAQDQEFHRLDDPHADYPGGVMTTQTSDGRAVPFVVRVESRTINRGIARIAVLDDPAARGAGVPFDARQWNQRVYYAFGESCGNGYQQGTNSIDMVLGIVSLSEFSADNLLINLVGIADRLSKGDAIVHSTLSAYGNHCNPLISVETTMMVKEHITETYGLIDAIVGTNGSGAALQQYNAANNAPGLISAAMPTASFADINTTAMTVTDCGLLERYYEESDLPWDDLKRSTVNGHNLLSGLDEVNAICQSWVSTFLDRIDPTVRGGCRPPQEEVYHPTENPTGVRCTVQDANVNLLGRDPETGFARRPLDNFGVQYGLEALQDGTISPEEFLDLNRNIGGYDIDGQWQPERHRMSSELAELVYRTGGVIGRGSLAETPVMDIAPYLDLIPEANIHEAVRPFIVRARLRDLTGQDASQSIWRGMLTQADAYDTMATWQAAVDATRPGYGGDHVQAVISAKPSEASDRCAFGTLGGRLDVPDAIRLPLGLAQLPLLPGLGEDLEDLPFDIDLGVPFRVDVPEDFDSGVGPCSLLLPVTATPRMVAGMPMTDDIIKCQLKPLDPSDYPDSLTDNQFAELQEIFPEGVCDFSKPAAEDVDRSMTWLSIGGEELQEPHELTWRVARSTTPALLGEVASEDDDLVALPATGGGPAPMILVLMAAAALVLRRTLSPK